MNSLITYIQTRAYAVYIAPQKPGLSFFSLSNMIYLTVSSLPVKKKKLSTHGQCERGVEGLRLCPNVVIQTSWMPFPVGIMNVKVVKGYGALDTAWTR